MTFTQAQSTSSSLDALTSVVASARLKRLIAFLRPQAHAGSAVAHAAGGRGVPTPTCIEDIVADRAFECGAELQSDHPGFHDEAYRERRKHITELARKHRWGEPLPVVEYTQQENETWATVINTLEALHPTHACRQFREMYALLDYPRDRIPQLREISPVLEARTGWRLRPVAGLLNPRDFLNGLAFKVFHSTQYIRHHSVPLYTPEPDVCHELLGHVPMLADPEFAELSQEIGRASLGATEEQLNMLATCYWFTVEFGLLREPGVPRGSTLRAYGAGLLSSFGELQHSVSGDVEHRPFNPDVVCRQPYPITRYQPVLFVADSLADAVDKLRAFSAKLRSQRT